MLRSPMLLIAAAFSLAAIHLDLHAAVTFLPGSTPQRANVGQLFAPISVRVTDDTGAPVAGARVRMYFSLAQPIQPDDTNGCSLTDDDSSIVCNESATDPNGVTQVRLVRGRLASATPHDLSINASTGTGSAAVNHGTATAKLTVDALGPAAQLEVLSGAGQRAPLGSKLPERFIVRATNADGSALAGLPVTFAPYTGELGNFEGFFSATVATDGKGVATAPPYTLERGIGPGTVRASFIDPNTSAFISKTIAFRTTTADGRDDRALQDMWWGGPSENGWGISIAQREDRLFPVVYAYDIAGNPTWVVLDTGGWAFPGRYERMILHAYRPTGSPYFAYDTRRFSVGPIGRMVNIYFDSESQGRLEFMSETQNAVATSKRIERQPYGTSTPAPITGIGGMWWGGPSQAGWGIAIMEQPGGLFAVWFTYDANGDRTWFVMSSGTWEGTTWSATLYKTRSSPFFEPAMYDASQFRVTPVGSVRIRFDGTKRATFDYNAEGHTGSMAIEPQPF